MESVRLDRIRKIGDTLYIRHVRIPTCEMRLTLARLGVLLQSAEPHARSRLAIGLGKRSRYFRKIRYARYNTEIDFYAL